MEGVGWIMTIILGGLAGWIAEKIMKSEMGLIGNIILGIVGALVLNFILGRSTSSRRAGGCGSRSSRIIGACILIFVYRLVRGRKA